jgi:hypothetical protein
LKNAYDADATFCNMKLEQRQGISVLEIVDDGTGRGIPAAISLDALDGEEDLLHDALQKGQCVPGAPAG